MFNIIHDLVQISHKSKIVGIGFKFDYCVNTWEYVYQLPMCQTDDFGLLVVSTSTVDGNGS